tara:strand:+ start:117 stop:332 length:216 start_codon:yes stop_codon:yes gene_type:complete
MSRLKNFLIDDLQKLERAYTEIDEIITDRVHYIKEDTKISEHLEVLENFISYWRVHSNNLEEHSGRLRDEG